MEEYAPPCKSNEEDFSCDKCMVFDQCPYVTCQDDCNDCKQMFRTLKETPPCDDCPNHERKEIEENEKCN